MDSLGMSGVVCRSFRPADGVGRKKTRTSAVEECRLLVARVEHMQRQVAMGV
jgi:hypothetical protein